MKTANFWLQFNATEQQISHETFGYAFMLKYLVFIQ